MPPPDRAFSKARGRRIAAAAAKAKYRGHPWNQARVVDEAVRISAMVIHRDGSIAGFQDKVQLDPSEEACMHRRAVYFRGGERNVRRGVQDVRYRAVRWAVRQSAPDDRVPSPTATEPGGYQPATFADPANSFHEKAALCRAAENTCFFATVNLRGRGLADEHRRVVARTARCSCYQPCGGGSRVAEPRLC